MAQQWMPTKPNFGPPPKGYVAGLGRGATGFITRSDLGPARIPENAQPIKPSEVDDEAYTDTKYDEWQGYKGALFSKNQADEQDKQAEEAYDYCERRVDGRRQEKKKDSSNSDGAVAAPINSIFVDLKRELSKISQEEWQNIPESVDSSIKKRRRQKYTPVPDSMLVHLLSSQKTRTVTDIEAESQDFRDAKKIILKTNLDRAEMTVEAQANIDKIGYLTQLDTTKVENQFVGDVQKARLLLRSAMQSNPKNADIWLSAARVEELDGKINDSRLILRKAVDQCPLNEDLWIELSRIEKPEQSQNLLIEGLRHIPSSEKLWIYASRKETMNKEKQSKLLRKGLEHNPKSVRLWRELIQQESVMEAKNLLYKAVECLPAEIDLWLALARMQDYENAKKILNKARKANPLSLAIWINAAKLEETQAKDPQSVVNKIGQVLTKGREILKKNGNTVNREQWIQEAYLAEKSNNLLTCEAIVKMSIGYALASEEIQNAVVKETMQLEREKQSNDTTRFLYKYGVTTTRNRLLLQKMIEFEKRKKNSKEKQGLLDALYLGIKIFPADNRFWLMVISNLIDEKEYEVANKIIEEAATKLDDQQKEEILLQKVKLLKAKGQHESARQQLNRLRELYPKGRSVLESIMLEYETKNFERAWTMCEHYFKENKSEQMWRVIYQIKRKVGTHAECFTILEKALEEHSCSERLWIDIISLELEQQNSSRARALIDKARLKLPKSEELSIMSVEMELKLNNKKELAFSLAKELKRFPKVSELWAIAILQQPHATRKKKANAAIEQCGNCAPISSAIAKVFWKQGKFDKAKRWFEEALKLDQSDGDVWPFYLKLVGLKFQSEKEKVFAEFEGLLAFTKGRNWLKTQLNEIGIKRERRETLELLMETVQAQINQFS